MRRKSGDVGTSSRTSNGIDVPKTASSSLPDSMAMPGGLPSSLESSSSMPDIDMDNNASEPSGMNGNNDPKKQDTPGRRAIFMVLRQKYLELIEAGQTVRALKVLRMEVAPAAADTTKLHALSGYVAVEKHAKMHSAIDVFCLHHSLMMCMKKADLYTKAKWDGATGLSRQELLDDLQGEYRWLPSRRKPV